MPVAAPQNNSGYLAVLFFCNIKLRHQTKKYKAKTLIIVV